jgi:hypothetical protein
VTQQFNTTTSMGRLTLNMLLSFAQFEREVTGERIRDKFAASRRKGMWMGGTVPLGYVVQDRKLVVMRSRLRRCGASTQDYLALGSVRLLEARLRGEGVVGKRGRPLGRGALFHMLQNRVYRGEVVHKGQVYPGEQAAIVDEALWERVQERLAAARSGGPAHTGSGGGGVGSSSSGRDASMGGSPGRARSLLPGILFDAAGERLTPTHAVKAGRRYRYYASRSLVTGVRTGAREGIRCPAGEIEALVTDWLLRPCFATAPALFGALQEGRRAARNGCRAGEVLQSAAAFVERWPGLEPASQAGAPCARCSGAWNCIPSGWTLQVNLQALDRLLLGANGRVKAPHPDSAGNDAANHAAPLLISVPARLRRSGKEVALVIGAGEAVQPGSTPLARLVAKAHRLAAALTSGEVASLDALASPRGGGPNLPRPAAAPGLPRPGHHRGRRGRPRARPPHGQLPDEGGPAPARLGRAAPGARLRLKGPPGFPAQGTSKTSILAL